MRMLLSYAAEQTAIAPSRLDIAQLDRAASPQHRPLCESVLQGARGPAKQIVQVRLGGESAGARTGFRALRIASPFSVLMGNAPRQFKPTPSPPEHPH
jgi:hypothetical protein